MVRFRASASEKQLLSRGAAPRKSGCRDDGVGPVPERSVAAGAAVRRRHQAAGKAAKGRILDEFCYAAAV